MNSKKQKMVVEDLRHINNRSKSSFRVKKLVNTIEWKIDEYIDEDIMRELIIHRRDLTVEIIEKK